MPEYLRALAVILLVATAVFALAKPLACAAASATADFQRRRNTWLRVTLLLFLSHNFWLFVILTAILLYSTRQREPNKLAMYYFLLFAAPMFSGEITGFGVIQHLVTVDYVRLLTFIVLFPEYLALRKQAKTGSKTFGPSAGSGLATRPLPKPPDGFAFGQSLPDKLLVVYLVLQFALMLKVDSLTNAIRYGGVYGFMDVFVPYYVASRSLRSLAAFRDVLMAFVVASLVLAATGAVEFARHWLLYSAVRDAIGIQWDLGNYLGRGESLRALGTTGQPIPFGYVMAVALGFMLYLRKSVPDHRAWLLGVAGLIVGLIAPLSRGPWIGAVAIVLMFIALGPAPVKNLTKVATIGVLGFPLLFVLPGGHVIIDHLPFIGQVDAENVTYRQLLLEISIQVIMQHPLFGAFDFVLSPAMQALKQGDGFIDFVNSYLGIALASGLVGLSLFAGFFVVVGVGIAGGMAKIRDRNDERYLLGRTLLCTLGGILITIFTVSSITVIPVIYWTVAGLGVAYARMLSPQTVDAVEPARLRRHGLQPSPTGGW